MYSTKIRLNYALFKTFRTFLELLYILETLLKSSKFQIFVIKF